MKALEIPSKKPMFRVDVEGFGSVLLKDDTLLDIPILCEVILGPVVRNDVGENPSECCTNPNTIRNIRELILSLEFGIILSILWKH